MSAIDISDRLITLFIEKDPAVWEEFLMTADYPKNYYLTFAAFVSTFVCLVFPHWFAKPVLTSLGGAILKNKQNEKEFILDKYLPEILKLTNNFTFPFFQLVSMW